MPLQYKYRQNRFRRLNNGYAAIWVSFCLMLPHDVRPERCKPLVARREKKTLWQCLTRNWLAVYLILYTGCTKIHGHQISPPFAAAKCKQNLIQCLTTYCHHYHHVPEGLGVFPVPWSSRWSWPLHLFLGRPMFLRPFGLYCSACFGSLFVSILYTCCVHLTTNCFFSYCTTLYQMHRQVIHNRTQVTGNILNLLAPELLFFLF